MDKLQSKREKKGKKILKNASKIVLKVSLQLKKMDLKISHTSKDYSRTDIAKNYGEWNYNCSIFGQALNSWTFKKNLTSHTSLGWQVIEGLWVVFDHE